MEESLNLINLTGFEGKYWRLANNWFFYAPLEEFRERPIKYLEIGTLYGANLITVAQSYGLHPESKLHCVDPWEDYEEYDEYKGEQPSIYEQFNKNIEIFGIKEKLEIKRGYSHKVVPEFEDEYFDLIYIDGNHEPEYVLEDAVLSFRKLKKGGIMIFDDYGWGGFNRTLRGIEGFLVGYSHRYTFLGIYSTQVFIRKK
jgi:hypothetical protein